MDGYSPFTGHLHIFDLDIHILAGHLLTAGVFVFYMYYMYQLVFLSIHIHSFPLRFYTYIAFLGLFPGEDRCFTNNPPSCRYSIARYAFRHS